MNLTKGKPTTFLSVVIIYFLFPHFNPTPPHLPSSSISILREFLFQKPIMPVIVGYLTTRTILYQSTILHYTAMHYTTLN